MTAYGIDFGTTNSALAVINNGEIEIARIDNPPVEWDRLGYDKVFPSVFGFGDNREALFGWDELEATPSGPGVMVRVEAGGRGNGGADGAAAAAANGGGSGKLERYLCLSTRVSIG